MKASSFNVSSGIDIDIGTAGQPMDSTRHLITFDPFDKPLIQPNYERLQFIVHPTEHGSKIPFYVNKAMPGCSSMLPINAAFENNATYLSDCTLENGCHVAEECTKCGPCCTTPHCARCGGKCLAASWWARSSEGRAGRDYFFHRFVLKCRRAPIETTSVPTLRLSQFLHERRIHHVHYLKIDAQGADRSIVHDVLSNSKVAIDKMRVECQLLDRATSMYGYSGDSNTMQPNDCRAIVELVRRHRPALMEQVEWSESNCHIAEYNIDFITRAGLQV